MNDIISPEVVLSIVVLSLVLYEMYGSALKVSVGLLFIVGVGLFPLGLSKSWMVASKLLIITGSASILLMGGVPTRRYLSLDPSPPRTG